MILNDYLYWSSLSGVNLSLLSYVYINNLLIVSIMLNQKLWFFSALPVMWNINVNKIQILWVLFSVMQNLKESQLYLSHSNKPINGASFLILKVSFNKTRVLTGNARIPVQHTQIRVFLVPLDLQQWNMWPKNSFLTCSEEE